MASQRMAFLGYGYVYDSETGLYYLQSRYYNPDMGRFINADSYASTGQGVLGYNMYAYCLNNPVCLVDNTGEVAATATATAAASCNPYVLIAALAVVAIVAVVDYLVDAVSSTQSISESQSPSYDKGQRSGKSKGVSIQSGQPTSPMPPKAPNNNRNNQYHGGTLYEDKDVHVDYEYNGNGTGNVHLQVKRGNSKYYYDSVNGVFRIGQSSFSEMAPRSVQKYLNNHQIQIALHKGIIMIRALGGTP